MGGDGFAPTLVGFYERTRGLTVDLVHFCTMRLDRIYTGSSQGFGALVHRPGVLPRVDVFGSAIDLVRCCTGQRTNPDATGFICANLSITSFTKLFVCSSFMKNGNSNQY